MHNNYSIVWSLPSTQRFFQEIGRKLGEGSSIIILLPRSIDFQDFQRTLVSWVENEWLLDYQIIDIGSANGNPPLEFFRSLFPKVTEYQFLEQMVESNFIPRVMLLSHLEKCVQNQRLKWLRIISRWAEACKSSGSQNCLVLITYPDTFEGIQLPPPDIRLSYQLWAGIPSLLEARLVYNFHVIENNAEDQWRDYMLSSLAGNDIQLSNHLWNVILRSQEDIFESLQQFALEKGWSKKDLIKELKNWSPSLSIMNNPKNISFALLSKGVIIYTPENGEQVHSAALALIDKKEEILHRLWTAQTALILPMVDEIRLRICDLMIRKNGKYWASEIDNQEPSFPDLGKLKHHFNCLPNTNQEKIHWSNVVNTTSIIRNELAHFKTINFAVFQKFWYQYARVRKTLNLPVNIT